MSKKKKGDLLEYFVAILEKSFQDNATTQILVKHILRDRDNVFREIDVYVEVMVNGKTLKYAFECKNHKSGISLNHITDFYSKIEGLGIMGYFVTTSHYQSGAISKANALNIHLYNLKKRELDGPDLQNILLYKKDIEVVDTWFYGNGDVDQETLSSIFTTCENCQKSLNSLLTRLVAPELGKLLDNNTLITHPELGADKKFQVKFGQENAAKRVMIVNCTDDTYITHLNERIYIKSIKVEFLIWNAIQEKLDIQSDGYTYSPIENNSSNISFSHGEFNLGGKKVFVTVTRHSDGNSKVAINNELDINSSKSFELFPIGVLPQEELEKHILITKRHNAKK